MYTLQIIVDKLDSGALSDVKILPADPVRNVRIAIGKSMQAQTLYLSADASGGTLCRMLSGSSFIYAEDLFSTLNRVLGIFDFYRTWEEELEKASRKGCTLTELLDLAYPIITHPILILDNNEWVIACTSVLEQMDVSKNEDLSDMLRFRSSSAQKIAAFNQNYHDVFLRKDVYQVPGDIFSANNGYAMNLFHENRFRGFMLIDSLDAPITQGKLDLFYILGKHIQDMLNDPSSGLSFGSEDVAFLRFLEDPSPSNKKELLRDLQIQAWGDKDEKQLIFIMPASGRSLSPNLNHALIMFNRLYGLKAAVYKTGILLFLNRKILDERFGFELVLQRIAQISYCGGISNTFEEIDELPLAAGRAYEALMAGKREVGSINYFYDYYMNYFFSLFNESDRKLLRHPLLDELKRYDKRYGSSLYKTLFQFLRNERGIAKTAQEMQLHRSTLLHRLERIDELSQGLLNNPEARMQILLSYYLEKAKVLPAE